MKTFDPGLLRHRVEIQAQVTTEDSSGEVVQSWSSVATVWACIQPMSARETIMGQAMSSDVTTRIIMRYRDDVTASMRILHRGREFNIRGVIPDPVSGLEWLTLPCSQGPSPG